jgi:hypothetical protein
MKPFIGWIIVILFSVALIGGFFFLKQSTSGAASEFTLGADSTTSPQTTYDPLPSEQIPQSLKEYHSNDYHFSIHYPGRHLSARVAYDRGDAMTVVFQAEAGQQGFQIYVAPINGTKITEERFLMDEPSGIKLDPHDTTVDGVEALAFHGFDAQIGQTYEVWFIRDHFLYEIYTYKELEQWLNQIMATWRFI